MSRERLPPAWYAGASEGDERVWDGVTWYVHSTAPGVIYWSLTRYGAVVGCSPATYDDGGF